MGLLEKAFQYKKGIKNNGEETSVDRVIVPAEKDITNEDIVSEDEKDDLDVRGALDGVNKEGGKGDNIVGEKMKDKLDVEPDFLEGEEFVSISEDDDLETDKEFFELTDDDEQSPLDILDDQRKGQLDGSSDLVEKMDSEGENIGQDGIKEQDEWEPFGKDDEPFFIEEEIVNLEDKSSDQDVEIEEEIVNLEDESSDHDIEIEEENDDLKSEVDKGISINQENGFNDVQVLLEISNDVAKVKTREELYDVILFSLMGQVGVSSASIMISGNGDGKSWNIVASIGVKIVDKLFNFNPVNGIIGQVIKNKGVIDLEEFKDRKEFEDDYYQFISIDARLACPLCIDETVFGIVVLGDKISMDDYTSEEKHFILSSSGIFSDALNKIKLMEEKEEENAELKANMEIVNYVDDLFGEIKGEIDFQKMREIIIGAFEKLGIEIFSIFLNNDTDFIPIIIEKDDSLLFMDSNFVIGHKNPFITYVGEMRDAVKIEEVEGLGVIGDAFNENQLKKMSHFWIYPFKIGNQLIGFIIIFKIDDKSREGRVDKILKRLSQILFLYIMNYRSMDVFEGRYFDNIELIYKRINTELLNVSRLKIPLTLVLFSIKNFKRYNNLFGYEKGRKLIDKLVGIIRERLSDNEFSVRYDRNKILVVLPGKNKKYSVSLGNAIRTEIIQGFKRREMQLLITFLIAEYPEDGDDFNSLLDSID